MLENKNKNCKINSLQRIHQQDEKNTWDCSEVRSKKWNYVGYTNDNTDQKYIWHIQKVHTNIAQYANDGGIQNLTTEKSDKGFIGKTHGMDDKIRMLGIKNCVGEHFCLGNESLFICHQVQGNDSSDEEILQKIN